MAAFTIHIGSKLSASGPGSGQRQIRFGSRAIGGAYPGPSAPSPRFRHANGRLSWTFCCRLASPGDRPSHPMRPRAKHSQSSPRRAHPAREEHPQAGPRVCLMRRHQHLLTTPLLLAPVPQGLEMHTHRCIFEIAATEIRLIYCILHTRLRASLRALGNTKTRGRGWPQLDYSHFVATLVRLALSSQTKKPPRWGGFPVWWTECEQIGTTS